MARIIKEIEIEGKKANALFDTGAVYTYVLGRYVVDSVKKTVREPYRVALGGRMIEIKELCLIGGSIEGLGFDTEAVPIDILGKVDGYELDAIVGALTMEQWEIKLDPKTQALDLEGLRRREFTEFLIEEGKK